MNRRRIIRSLVLLTALGASQGCYKRVVDARGIGADSRELRERQERESVLRDALTTSRERESKPSSGVW